MTHLDLKAIKAVTLDECPEGLFLFNETLGFKSEYATVTPSNPRQCDAYVVESGEYFWGGTSNSLERGKLLVRPLDAPTLVKGVEALRARNEKLEASNRDSETWSHEAVGLADDMTSKEFWTAMADYAQKRIDEGEKWMTISMKQYEGLLRGRALSATTLKPEQEAEEPKDPFSYIYITQQRKAWYFEEPEGWIEHAFERFDYVECGIFKKLTADLTGEDAEVIESYGEPDDNFCPPSHTHDEIAEIVRKQEAEHG